MDILIVFILKALDIAFSTAKTIYINKKQYCKAALLSGAATIFYSIAIVNVVKSNSIFCIFAMAIKTLVGTLIPGVVIEKTEKDRVFEYDITSDTLESGQHFGDVLREHNLAVKTYKTFDSKMHSVLTCKVYCDTKEESRLVESLIPKNFKYHIYLPREE